MNLFAGNPHLSLTAGQWILACAGAVVIGASRTAIRGAAFLAIPIFASLIGARVSSGIVLLMYITGDLFAVRTYRREVDWSIIRRIVGPTAVGVLVGVLVGGRIDDRGFAIIIASVVLVSALLVAVREFRGEDEEMSVPRIRALAIALGLLGGFTSMIGNAAGPLMNLFFLSIGLRKVEFVGTAAWFFFIVNLFKVPFHVWVWGTMTVETLGFNLIMIVPVVAGTLGGIWLVGRVPERPFRVTILGLTIIAAVRLLIGTLAS